MGATTRKANPRRRYEERTRPVASQRFVRQMRAPTNVADVGRTLSHNRNSFYRDADARLGQADARLMQKAKTQTTVSTAAHRMRVRTVVDAHAMDANARKAKHTMPTVDTDAESI